MQIWNLQFYPLVSVYLLQVENIGGHNVTVNKTFETIPLQDGGEAEVEMISELNGDDDDKPVATKHKPVATKQERENSQGWKEKENSHIKMNGKDEKSDFKKIAEKIENLRNTKKL